MNAELVEMKRTHKSMFGWFVKKELMINHLEMDEGVIEDEEPVGMEEEDRRAREERFQE